MKTKEKQGYSYILSLAALLLALTCAILCGVLPTVAAQNISGNNFLEENYNMTEEYSALLGEESNLYSSLDKSSQKEVSKQVLALINLYRKQLLDLQSHPDADVRTLSKEIKLAYEQGRAVGALGWIYHYNYPRLRTEEARLVVKSEFESYLSEIDRATDASVLSARADVISALMNRAVFSQLIKELSGEGDSLACASLIAGALAKAELIDASDLFADELSALLADTKQALSLQRGRDTLSKQLSEIFPIILPDSDHASDKTVALFTYKLKNAESIEEMNSALQSALETLLYVPESNIYSRLYRSELGESVAEATLKASNGGVPADLLPLFAEFPTLSARAETKDEIRSILLGSDSANDKLLAEIEKQFNSQGGIVDHSPKELLTLEITRASTARSCHSRYTNTLDQLGIVLLPYGYESFEARARACFEEFTQKLYALEGYAGFDESCSSLLSSAKGDLDDILCEAKAERFLLDHKSIISKPSEALSAGDELALRSALCDYSSLEERVREALISQINSIAEKYNTVLSQIIQLKLKDDALYLDLCEIICKELQNLSKVNIAEYYNNCDQILKKSDLLASIISAYRTICSDELYSSFNASEREELVVICRDSAQALGEIDVNDKVIFDSELEDILDDAKIKMSRTRESVRIRVALRSSENAQIKALAAEANAKIKASYDFSEMAAIADKAIFKINRLLCIDAITLHAEEKKYLIGEMQFLTSDEKNALYLSIDSLSKSSSESAALAENLTVLGFIWNTFGEKLGEIYRSGDEKNLARSKDEHIYLFDKEVEKLTRELRAMVNLSSAKCDEYLNKLGKLQASFKAGTVALQTSTEVEKLYKESLEALNSIRISASQEDLENYKSTVLGKLDALRSLKANYSAENYNKVLTIIEAARESVVASGSIGDCTDILERVNLQISAVNDLLDDAKEDALAKLEALASTYRSQSELYSSTALSAIDQILSEGKRRINSFSEISEIPALKAELEERLTSLRSVRKDYLTTAPGGLSFTADGAEYPLQYDFAEGYWALLHSTDGLPADAILSVSTQTGADLQDIQKLIRNAAKDGKIKFLGSKADSSTRSLLKSGVVSLGFDISLGDIAFPEGPITLQMLLPSSLKEENLLGVAFVGEDGSVEFYSIEQRDMLISLQLEHFSNYYILVENTIDLFPLILLLTALIILEFLIFGVLIFIRRNRKRKEQDDMFPILPAYFLAPLPTISAVRVRPSGAVGATILLSIAALALGCGIAILARSELRRSEARKVQPVGRKRKTVPQSDTPLLSSVKRSLLKAKTYELDAPKESSKDEENDAQYYGTEASTEKVPCAVGALEDSEIAEISYESHTDDEAAGAKRRRRFEINLDVIENSFEAGELVTLDALKRRNIAPKRAEHLKILARGALSKPLIIEAHEFTHAAEEMLRAVGGEAIRIRR